MASCIELLLQVLERQRYTPAYDKWLGLVSTVACLTQVLIEAASSVCSTAVLLGPNFWLAGLPIQPLTCVCAAPTAKQVQGHKLISALARNVQGAYPPGVQQAATQLKVSATCCCSPANQPPPPAVVL